MAAIATGRPSGYSEDLADEICGYLSTGMSMASIALLDHMPEAATMFRWLGKYASFCDKYARAQEQRAIARVERMDSIAEQVLEGKLDPNAARVVLDTMKWVAARESPKKYGDRLELNGSIAMTHSIAEALRMREATLAPAIDVAPDVPRIGSPDA